MPGAEDRKKRIVIFGGTGFIGKHLINELSGDYNIIVVSRSRRELAGVQTVRLRKNDYRALLPYFEDVYGVINLAGENVGRRWSKELKVKIRDSRIDIDTAIVQLFNACTNKPKFIFQGSNIGVYGLSRTQQIITEKDQKGKHGFLTRVANEHEKMFHQLEKHTRVVYLRTGIVLGTDGGALPKMAMPFKLFLGGKLGNGKQWNSWIHIRDEVRAIRFLIEAEDARGPYNLCAPQPVQQKVLAKTLGKIMNKPSFMTAPAFVLRLVLGEMADEMLLNGLNIIPQRLQHAGFIFEFESLEKALNDLIRPDRK